MHIIPCVPGYSLYQQNIFTGGNTVTFRFKLRTERANGFLFYAYGAPGVYWFVQIISGGLFLQFGDLSGVKKYLIWPKNTGDVNLCDGKGILL